MKQGSKLPPIGAETTINAPHLKGKNKTLKD